MIYRDGNKRGKKINKNRSLFITVYAMTNQNNKDFCSISKMKSRKDTKFYSNVYNKLVKMKKEKSVIKINSINIIKSNYIAGQIKLTWGISSLGASRGNVNRSYIDCSRHVWERETRNETNVWNITMRVLRNQRAVHDTSHIKRIFFPDTFIPHLHSTVCGHDYTYQHRRRGIPTARKRYFH